MRKEELVETLSFSEVWQPSVQLRFIKINVIDFNHKVIGEICLQKHVNILQQLHTSNLGNREWKDVPIRTES